MLTSLVCIRNSAARMSWARQELLGLLAQRVTPQAGRSLMQLPSLRRWQHGVRCHSSSPDVFENAFLPHKPEKPRPTGRGGTVRRQQQPGDIHPPDAKTKQAGLEAPRPQNQRRPGHQQQRFDKAFPATKGSDRPQTPPQKASVSAAVSDGLPPVHQPQQGGHAVAHESERGGQAVQQPPGPPVQVPAPQVAAAQPAATSPGVPAAGQLVAGSRLQEQVQAANANSSRDSLNAAAKSVVPAALPTGEGDAAATSSRRAPPIRDLLHAQGIVMRDYSPGQKPHMTCPQCAGGSSGEASLAVVVSDDSRGAAWLCHRGSCGWKGAVNASSGSLQMGWTARSMDTARAEWDDAPAAAKKKPEKNPPHSPNTSRLQPLSQEMLDFFASRGISPATLERNGVQQEVTWMPGAASNTAALAFPYCRNGEVVNIKYRTLNKQFRQVKGAEKVLYGLDDVAGQSTIVVVEGEMDKLALEEAGLLNVVSVPDGAPRQVKEGELPPQEADVKYSYLWNCRGVWDQATRIVLATDNDGPGHALAEELARRLGRERCFRVRWSPPPQDRAVAAEGADPPADSAFRKDANDVLLSDGKEALLQYIEAAEPYPIRGLFRFSEFSAEVWSYFNLDFGDEMGMSTGWTSLDEVYRVVPGELTIITGVPNSGKSEWIDALLVNLAWQHGWCFAMCSMEKKVKDHARQLIEKYHGRPFFDSIYAKGVPRMSTADVEDGLAWLDERFHLIRYEDDELPSVDWVLNLARAAVLRYGIRGLVIDPYNELDHQRPSYMSETEYVSQMLTKIKRFAQYYDVHVWFVAHPRQMRDWKGEPPTMYDISGSAHFINKADNGVVVHRNRNPDKGPMNEVQILVRKVRNKAAGTIGEARLTYDKVSGRYNDALGDHGPPKLDEHEQAALPPPSQNTYAAFTQNTSPQTNDNSSKSKADSKSKITYMMPVPVGKTPTQIDYNRSAQQDDGQAGHLIAFANGQRVSHR